MPNTIFIILIVVSVILVLTTVALVGLAFNRFKNYAECEGTITGFHESSAETAVSEYENVAISPIVEYEVNGKKYTFIGKYFSTSMKVGDKVKVAYNPSNVSEATIEKGLLFAPLVTGAISIVLLIGVIIYYFLR